MFAPVKIKDSYYVDGGTLNNFPIEFLKPSCDIIVGSYANWVESITIKELKYSHQVIERALKLRALKDDYDKFKGCDLMISPKELSKYSTFDKKHINMIFNVGYNATIAALSKSDLFKTEQAQLT